MGAKRMIATAPRYLASQMDEATINDIDVLSDGGIRDLFNWAVMSNITTAGWTARGRAVRLYNDHAALHLDGRDVGTFDYNTVPWDEIGRYAMVRYGDPDADATQIIRPATAGTSGTAEQITNRLYAALTMMSARWPDGDRAADARPTTSAARASSSCGYAERDPLRLHRADHGPRGPGVDRPAARLLHGGEPRTSLSGRLLPPRLRHVSRRISSRSACSCGRR